jgi:hypothetical protein
MQLDATRVEIGRLNAARVRSVERLEDAEFRVFSQFGEDGIIQWLVQRVEIPSRTFVEFGVEDYRESNTRFLVEHDDWSGLAIDGGESHKAFVEQSQLGWRHTVDTRTAFLTAQNLDAVIGDAGYRGDIGLVCIDVDGMDYWLLEALSVVSPRVLVAEYNNLFGPERAVTVPYDPAFDRTAAHWSTLYFGASIAAITSLAASKGYALVGSNQAGTNAFFVRRDVVGSIPERAAEDVWRDSTVRQARDVNGQLLYLGGRAQQLHLIADLPLLDVVSGERSSIGKLFPS